MKTTAHAEYSDLGDLRTQIFRDALEAYQNQDFLNSLQLLRKIEESAIPPNPHVHYFLGRHYDYGQGTDVNPEKAKEYYEFAASWQVREAQLRLAELRHAAFLRKHTQPLKNRHMSKVKSSSDDEFMDETEFMG